MGFGDEKRGGVKSKDRRTNAILIVSRLADDRHQKRGQKRGRKRGLGYNQSGSRSGADIDPQPIKSRIRAEMRKRSRKEARKGNEERKEGHEVAGMGVDRGSIELGIESPSERTNLENRSPQYRPPSTLNFISLRGGIEACFEASIEPRSALYPGRNSGRNREPSKSRFRSESRACGASDRHVFRFEIEIRIEVWNTPDLALNHYK